ncbi:MAG TPA: ABC transporter substrate-binding protein [Thermodesulfobacteriota bacterium]
MISRLLGALAALLLCAAGATAAETPPAPRPGGAVTVAALANPDGLDPHRSPADSTFIITMNIFDSLVATNARGELLPGLAERWDISRDGLTYTFELRRGVTFHDGKPLTSADVKYSLARMAEKGRSPHAADYAVIARVETPSPTTVAITLSRPSARFLSDLAYGWAAIVPEGAGDGLARRPIGTGPFRFVEWVPDSHIKLVKNARYFVPGRPYLDEVLFKVIPDETARVTALRAGEIDITERIPPQMVEELRANRSLRVETYPSNTLSELAINAARKPFDDLRVRRALFHAIDRAAVLEGANFGYGRLIGSFMAPIIGEYYVDLNGRYPHDVAKAKALLAEAGYPNGFETTLYLPQPYPDYSAAGEIIASQLTRVGIRARLETLEWGQWLDRVYKQKDYALTTIGHYGRLDPMTLLERFKTGYNANYFGYSNPEFDRLLTEGDGTHDRAKRRAIVRRLQELLSEDAACVFLVSRDAIVGFQRDVWGYAELPIPGNRLTDVYRASR